MLIEGPDYYGPPLIEVYGGLREERGMKTCLHGPRDYAKTMQLRFRVGDQDLPERRGIPVVEGRRCTDVPLWQCRRVKDTIAVAKTSDS